VQQIFTLWWIAVVFSFYLFLWQNFKSLIRTWVISCWDRVTNQLYSPSKMIISKCTINLKCKNFLTEQHTCLQQTLQKFKYDCRYAKIMFNTITQWHACYVAWHCYRRSSVVCLWCGLSVCVSVGHVREPCINAWTDRDAVWGAVSSVSWEPCIRWESTSDESIRSRYGDKSAMRPFFKVLWTRLHCATNWLWW